MSNIPMTPEGLSAEELFRTLRALRAQLPEPQALEPGKASSRLAHVDPNYVHAAVNAIGASENVQKALGRTPEELRSKIDDIVDWNSVAGELRAMLQAVTAANIVRKREVGLAVVQANRICEQLARDPANASLTAHIDEMKRLNKFGRRRRRAQTAPQPQPEPAVKPQ